MNAGVIFWLIVYIISAVLFFTVAVIITLVGLKDLRFLTGAQESVKVDKNLNN